MVIVAAVFCILSAFLRVEYIRWDVLTDAHSHAGSPTLFELASEAIRSYTDATFLGAGIVFGFA